MLWAFAALLMTIVLLSGCSIGDDEETPRPASAVARLTIPGENGQLTVSRSALRRVVASRDRRFAIPLIELLRAGQVGITDRAQHQRVIDALEELTGRDFGTDWPAWLLWEGRSRLCPPPGFRDWKAKLFGRLDRRFEGFLAAGRPSRIAVEEVVWGGVEVDGIPPLERPRTIPAARARYLDPQDPVFGVELGGETRAYPLRILDWHELANDRIGGVPVSLVYCTLCGAGVLYETRTPDRTFTFGTSGFLMRSNKLMYDRQTRTLWNQLSGEPVLGPLAARERRPRLRIRPLVVTTWARWRRRHPGTRVLSVRTGFDRPYHRGAAYGEYFASPDTLFPARRPGRGLRSKERVFALRVGSAAKAYPLRRLESRPVVSDRLGGRRVVVVLSGRRITTTGRDFRTGQRLRYDSGGEVRAFARGRRRFRSGRGGAVFDERGRRWRVGEQALIGPGGERLRRLPGHLAYAFGWLAYFPRTEVFGERGRGSP